MTQSDLYKRQEQIDRVHDLVGADVPRDVLKVAIGTQDVPLDVSGSEIGVSIDSQTLSALDTDLAAALVSNATDTLRVEQQSPVGVEDSGGAQVDPATETTLSALVAALESNGGDTLRVDQQGVLDVSSRDSRNLGDVDVTSIPSVTISELPSSDFTEAFEAALSADQTNSYTLAAHGADALDGRAKSSGQYDVTVEWLDSSGNVIKSNAVATAVAGGTWTDLSGLTAITPFADVKIADTSSASQTATVVAHLR